MIDFVEYVVSELKSKKLSKSDALALIRQYSRPLPIASGAAVLHPLLHRNTSDLNQQSYGTSFSGDEFFLRDHRVQGRKMLPGVAYLEMARAAIALALPDRAAAGGLELRNVAWAQPIVFPEQREVTLALFASDEPGRSHDRIDIEVFSGEDTVHFQGQAIVAEAASPASHDLTQLRSRAARKRMDASTLYSNIASMGIDLGPAHQGVRAVQQGERELVVDIRRPDETDDSHERYLLHPSVMDSALQAGMALIVGSALHAGSTPVPFALESLRIFGGCEKDMIAWVRYSPGAHADGRIVKLDIDLCDTQGHVRVQMLGFSSRLLGAEIGQPQTQPADIGCLLAAPAWEEAEAPAASGIADAGTAQAHVFLCDIAGITAAQLDADAAATGRYCDIQTSQHSDLAERYGEAVLACFEKVRAILQGKPQGKVLLQIVVPNDDAHLPFDGLSGLLKTATAENPHVIGQLVRIEADTTAAALEALLRRERQGALEPLVKYENGQRYVRRLHALNQASDQDSEPNLCFKDHGVYAITGGLGGLGIVFAKQILAQTRHAVVVLTGRAEPTAERQAALDALGADARARVHYRQLNLADAQDVRQFVAGTVQAFGRLNGILHSAGMIQDNFILKKTPDEVARVLGPKVAGTWHLDQATRDIDLDFLALFSSGVSVFGNAGQADYAAANGFMDGFASYRNRLVAEGQRRGLTVALDWPLWQEGGMAVDAANREALRKAAGMEAMRTDTGVRAFHRVMELRSDQVLVVEGDRQRMRQALLSDPTTQTTAATAASAPVPAPADAAGTAGLRQKAQDFLRRQFSDVLKLAAHRIDPLAPLERYGIDSILAMELTGQLERSFGSLPKTLFFEYQTIDELTEYFLRDYASKLSDLLGSKNDHGAKAAMPAAVPTRDASSLPANAPSRAAARNGRRFKRSESTSVSSISVDPIAIVGLSGRYPEAETVEAYWHNLREGRDCITEIPKDRWDWRDYYREDRTAEGAHYSKWGGFIAGVDEFDPLFFNIPPVDAELIDPQERLFLQHAWMAVEDAGYTRAGLQGVSRDGLAGHVGVYVGVMYGEYQLFGAESSLQGKRLGIPVSYASIANRVSYVFNLHGPSMTLDTMCSSSLTAIHLACQDLRQGRTHLAIAGGVNVTIHPNKYLILSAGQFISSDGHCQSFGEGGDGYIPGEGVGAVVLKRLSDAQRDGNHIYGVIKGSALNHGGKTNGYSVPNPKAQADVIRQALKEYDVDARHVSYIEAHGTGTRLGDPIEIAALTQVFRQYTQERQFCAIGSAKSNIGHCESAAGIAGLTKILLQMKHKLIVPSLHSSTLNPHIDFESSPFVVNQTLQAWTQPEIDGRRLPRIAGLSSFGAGGSNAHLIIEEYPATEPAANAERAETSGGSVLIPLSARTAAQLKSKARDLLAFIDAEASAPDLHRMAYTLQIGREAMDARLAFVVESVAQLAEKLKSYVADEPGIDQCFQGEIAQGRDGISSLAQDEDMVEAIDKWIARGKLSKLADLWVKGLELDWRKLHAGHAPSLISLPTYPFAKDRYWVARSSDKGRASGLQRAAALHPLLHTNTSDFFQQSYLSEFDGGEFFFTDHQIDTGAGGMQKVLPAVAYLEMIRAAVDLAIPANGQPRQLDIRNVAWAQPVVASDGAKVSTSLLASGERSIDFEMSSIAATSQEPTVHCQGHVEISATVSSHSLDLPALKEKLSQRRLSAETVYDAFRATGLHYGRSFQGIASLHTAPGQVLAELHLPESPEAGSAQFALPPGLLDSALQAAIGLIEDIGALPPAPSVPFALDSMRLLSACKPRMFAWIRHSDNAQVHDGLTKLDIDLCDESGIVCVRLAGLTSRTLRAAAEEHNAIGALIAQPVWEARPLTAPSSEQATHWQSHHVLLCGLDSVDQDRLRRQLAGSQVARLSPPTEVDMAGRYTAAALACFDRLQTILRDKPEGRVLFQLVVEHDGQAALLAGLSAMLDTARLENPNLVGQLVLADAGSEERTLASQLLAARGAPGESHWTFQSGIGRVLRWQPEAVRTDSPAAFKDRGVYLITGGLGGLGLLFAKEILQTTRDATIVFTGRSTLTDEKRGLLEQLARDYSVSIERLVYRTLDLNRLEQVESVVAGIVENFGGLTGVLHSAGMTRDGFIIHKRAEEFAEVLAPKVNGTVHLDLATQALDLEFMALFSSITSAFGNAGQVDYAAANGFMDRFAAYRNGLRLQGLRSGTTVAIHWPLWQDGGMQLDEATRMLLMERSGMQPLRADTGMQAFHHGLVLASAQVLVVEGDVGRLKQSLRNRHSVAQDIAAPKQDIPTGGDSATLLETAKRYLIEEFSSLLKIPPHEVDAKAPLEKYGIDSVLTMKFTQQLERSFGSLSKTLLFEYQTIAALAAYLVRAFPQALREQSGQAAVIPSPSVQGRAVSLPVPTKHRLLPLARNKSGQAGATAANDAEVAIIGVSGRYPQASNLHEFWDNLKQGRDCITEVPQERWDHARLYHPERNQPGKTYSKWGGFIGGIDEFDPLFFSISPKEAELMDPQERLFIETAWETIEDAGYSKDGIAKHRVGVYVGAMWGQYELYGATPGAAGVPSSSFASIANRVSYFFNFQGPSLALDTMCSSSLTAIHLASEDVRKGSVDLAIAGGVNVSVHPSKYLSLSQGNFASTDGRCRSFGEGGDGYVPGEGVGAVLLKSLDKAIADGDQIYAVVRASAINHGGKTNGYTVPNPVAQGDLIRETFDKARIAPDSITYIETHGTGTSLGDPIEITGLVRAFENAQTAANVSEMPRCPIGSVKSNIGHLESAAGIAAVTKVLLQFKHQQLVPSLHADPLNPYIDFNATPFRVQTSLQDWTRRDGRPHRAAVSSFGAGGSNAHLILEEFADVRSDLPSPSRPEVFVLSARNRDALAAYARRMADFLEDASTPSLTNIAFTSQVGRTPMQERLAIVASDVPALARKLREWLSASTDKNAPADRTHATRIQDVYEGNTRDARSSASALIEGDAGRAFLQLTLEQRDLDKLAKLWVTGMEIDWARLYRAELARRVSLPTYPFQKERYWIGAQALPDRPAVEPALPPAPRQRLYYQSEWQRSDLPASAGAFSPDGPILVLDHNGDLAAELRRRYPAAAIVLATFGEAYGQIEDRAFTVDASDEAGLASLVGELSSRNLLPTTIVHRTIDDGELTSQLDRGVFALHGLCRELIKRKSQASVRIVAVQAPGQADGQPLHDALGAYLKTLALENPKFSGKVVSIRDDASLGAVVERVSHELHDDAWNDEEVRYLVDRLVDARPLRRVKRLTRYVPGALESAIPPIKQGGVYVVTGGLGGLGYLFSRHLAERYGARLVLTGRSPLDAALQDKLSTLNTRGAQAVYIQADVADAAQATALVEEAKLTFSQINGVIHSAGIHRDAFVLNKSRADMAAVLSAKVAGTINLDLATREETLDLFVVFSSVAGVLGNPGQSDYAYANHFLDAFSERRQAWVDAHRRHGRTLSIDWPFWEDGGMRLGRHDIDQTEQRTGVSPLPTEEGFRIWDTFLQSQLTQGVALYGQASKVDGHVLKASARASSGTPASRASGEVTPNVALEEAAQHYLKELLGEQIGLTPDRIDAQERFDAFGVDSMMISRMNATLEQDLGELPKTLFYEYATIEELAAYLCREAFAVLAGRFKLSAATAAEPAGTTSLVDETAQPAGMPTERTDLASSQAAEPSEKIAIIGLHGYFPGSASLAEFWEHLKQGRDLTDLVPESRWDLHEFFDADPENAKDGKIYCKWGAFLEDFDKFDANFFGIAADDARMIDPQERLFLQSVWAAVEDAGYTRDSLRTRYPKAKSADVGVFGGVTTNSYHLLTPEEWSRGNMVTPGAMPWSITNRVSYVFDFQGPSMPVDTACSSSLVAMHLACESLKRKECQVAIAGGVNLYLHPSKYQSLCRRRMLAVDGKCRSFGAGDDGFVPGEGVGAVVLKPLNRAIEDRDHIYGVIASSAYEHSGRSNGYSAPNPNSQANLIEKTLRKADIHPESIGYVEGHGTGTQLGDSLEVVSLNQAFQKQTRKTQFCALGSVKANVGHSESAAGITGVAKILLQFKHRQIAPTLHSDVPNPNIDFGASPFRLQHSLTAWEAPTGQPRRAMINSFGAGGVNACLILEEYAAPVEAKPSSELRPQLFVLSARNDERLREAAARLAGYLGDNVDIDPAALAYTLQTGRETMEERLTLVASGTAELANELNRFLAGTDSPNRLTGRVESHRRRKSLKPDDRARAQAHYAGGELDALARMWVDGQDLDWNDFHGVFRPTRVPLPSYPFAKERYWVSDAPLPEKRMTPKALSAQLHPLVAHNASTLKEVSFSSFLSASEYYARDHRVNGERFFPGAGFVELACVGGTIAGEQAVVGIEDIVWTQPLKLPGERQLVKIVLTPGVNGADYVVVSFDDDNERVVHSEGRLIYGSRKKSVHQDTAIVPIHDLKAQSTQRLPGAACYQALEKFGFQYGRTFQTIQELHIGNRYALSKLALADELKADFDQYILHPTLIDGALQTVLGVAGEGGTDTPYLPFALGGIELLAPLSEVCYALAEPTASSTPRSSDIRQFTIRLLSESGELLAKLNNFYVRALGGGGTGRHNAAGDLLTAE